MNMTTGQYAARAIGAILVVILGMMLGTCAASLTR